METEIVKSIQVFNTKTAGEAWNLKPRVVASYCKNGRIKGAYKEKNKWIIPIKAIKPLSKGEITNTVAFIIRFKVFNNLINPLGSSEKDIKNTISKLKYLSEIDLLDDFNEIDIKNDFDKIKLTEKGFDEFLLEIKKTKNKAKLLEYMKIIQGASMLLDILN